MTKAAKDLLQSVKELGPSENLFYGYLHSAWFKGYYADEIPVAPRKKLETEIPGFRFAKAGFEQEVRKSLNQDALYGVDIVSIPAKLIGDVKKVFLPHLGQGYSIDLDTWCDYEKFHDNEQDTIGVKISSLAKKCAGAYNAFVDNAKYKCGSSKRPIVIDLFENNLKFTVVNVPTQGSVGGVDYEPYGFVSYRFKFGFTS